MVTDASSSLLSEVYIVTSAPPDAVQPYFQRPLCPISPQMGRFPPPPVCHASRREHTTPRTMNAAASGRSTVIAISPHRLPLPLPPLHRSAPLPTLFSLLQLCAWTRTERCSSCHRLGGLERPRVALCVRRHTSARPRRKRMLRTCSRRTHNPASRHHCCHPLARLATTTTVTCG